MAQRIIKKDRNMKVWQWACIGLSVLMTVILGLYGFIYLQSEARIQEIYPIPVQTVAIPTDNASLIEGKRLFISRGCSDCHGDNLSGKIFIDDPVVGTLAGSNLTSGKGGIGSHYKEVDFIRAIRHGIAPDNKPLIYMPSQEYHAMNDEQLGAIIAYIRSAPPVSNNPPMKLGFLMRLNFLLGKVPLLAAEIIDHQAINSPVTLGATVEYGQYLMNGCMGCHGKDLSGGPVPGAPATFPKASNLTKDPKASISQWTEGDFFKAMRQGIRPDGSKIDAFMPWKNFSQMTDTELKAIWLYLQTLPAKS